MLPGSEVLVVNLSVLSQLSCNPQGDPLLSEHHDQGGKRHWDILQVMNSSSCSDRTPGKLKKRSRGLYPKSWVQSTMVVWREPEAALHVILEVKNQSEMNIWAQLALASSVSPAPWPMVLLTPEIRRTQLTSSIESLIGTTKASLLGDPSQDDMIGHWIRSCHSFK